MRTKSFFHFQKFFSGIGIISIIKVTSRVTGSFQEIIHSFFATSNFNIIPYKPEIFFLLTLFSSILLSCSENKGEDKLTPEEYLSSTTISKPAEEKIEIPPDIFPKINYTRTVIKNRKHLANLLAKFGENRALKTLNRKEYRFFRVGDTIVVPDTILNDIRAYSAFPEFYPRAAKIKKIIIVSNKFQCYACYEFGKLVRFAAVNSGKERTPSYPGRYALVWRERMHLSSLDSSWKMPFTWNFHSEAGNAFHQFEMPGRPVSHSCVRQFLEDSEWLYYWGEGIKKDSLKRRITLSGTPVLIIDIFNFTRKRGGPWLEIKSNKDSIFNLPADPMNYEEALIPWCQIPKDSRGSLRDRKRFLFAEDTLRARGIIRPGVKLIETQDFNKKRREKARREAKKKELEKKQDVQ
ncbi:MAG: Murein L,D-transpeptidase [Ignavibacteria bacterium]|nr:Murein L,D-transpeptidase [Ignavibacteria bacterium]